MARQQEKHQLNQTEQLMLLALVRLGNRHREACFPYPMIAAEIKNYTGSADELHTRELMVAKKPLIELGLIVDKQVGFAPTEEGYARFPGSHQQVRVH